MPKRIIQVETTVSCVLGVLDDDGDVVSKHPYTVSVPKLTADAMSEALRAIRGQRNLLASSIGEEEGVSEGGN